MEIQRPLSENDCAGAASTLLEGCWWEVQRPFRHFRATEVLDGEAYARVAERFSALLRCEETGKSKICRFVHSSSNYDAEILAIRPELVQEFAPFFDEAWLRGIAQLLELPFEPAVDGALHSSPPNSRTGWIHTDCCSAWFNGSRADHFLQFPDRRMCDYFTGQKKHLEASPKEYVRAATLIFYLCNDAWRVGWGGETALYSASGTGTKAQVNLVPPINNTLLLFECSPHAHHRFLTNPGCRRNSLILWLHSTVEHAQARWGDGLHRSNGNR